MIRTPNAPGATPPPGLFASLSMSMHYVLGIALAMPNAHLSSCPGRGTGTRTKRGIVVVEAVLTEWLSLIVRWLHVVAGIAWIGSSFYFIHLDLSLNPGPGFPQGGQ